MHKLHRAALAISFSFLAYLCGCYSSSTGTKMDTNQVSKIEKGKTTRKEVEAMLGTPSHVAMMAEGRRVMTYHFNETNARVKGQSFIPFYGAFGGGSKMDSHQQALQINLDKNGIVEDYEFNDNTSNTDVSHNAFGGSSVTSTPAAPATPGK